MNMVVSPERNQPEIIDIVPGRVGAMLGAAVAMMPSSPVHRDWTVTDVARLIGPPLLLRQCFAFDDGLNIRGFVTWANLTEEAEAGFLARTRLLQPEDWNAGDGSRIWIIDALMPFGGVLGMLRRVAKEMRAIMDANNWPATEVKWTRTLGTDRVQHVGSIKR